MARLKRSARFFTGLDLARSPTRSAPAGLDNTIADTRFATSPQDRGALWETCFHSACPTLVPSLFDQGMRYDPRGVLLPECLAQVLTACASKGTDGAGALSPARTLLATLARLPSGHAECARVILECLRTQPSLRRDPAAGALALEVVAQAAHLEQSGVPIIVMELRRLLLDGGLVETLDAWSDATSAHRDTSLGVEALLNFWEILLDQVHSADLIERAYPRCILALVQSRLTKGSAKTVVSRLLRMCHTFPKPSEVLHLFKKRSSTALLKTQCIRGIAGAKAMEALAGNLPLAQKLGARHSEWLVRAAMTREIFETRNPLILRSVCALLVHAGAADELVRFVSENLRESESRYIILCELMAHAAARQDPHSLASLKTELVRSPMEPSEGTCGGQHRRVLEQVSLAFFSEEEQVDADAVGETLKDLATRSFQSRTDEEHFDGFVLCLDKLYCTLLSALASDGRLGYNVKSLLCQSSRQVILEPVLNLCMAQDILVRSLKINRDTENQGSVTSLHRLCEHARAMHRHHTHANQNYQKMASGESSLPRYCWQALAAFSLSQCTRPDLWFPAAAQVLKMPAEGSTLQDQGGPLSNEGDHELDLKSFSTMYEFNSVMTLSVHDVSQVLRLASQSAHSLLLAVSTQGASSNSQDHFSRMVLSLVDLGSLIGSYPVPLSPPLTTFGGKDGVRPRLDIALRSGVMGSIGKALAEGGLLASLKSRTDVEGGKHLLLCGTYMVDIMLSISWIAQTLHGSEGLKALAHQLTNTLEESAGHQPAVDDLLLHLKCTLTDMLGPNCTVYRIVVAAGLLETYILFSRIRSRSESSSGGGGGEDIYTMSVDLASKAWELQAREGGSLECDKLCLLAARGWQAITSSPVRCHQMEKNGPSWRPAQGGRTKVESRMRRVLNEISAHYCIAALRDDSPLPDISREGVVLRSCLENFLAKTKSFEPGEWSPDLSLDGLFTFIHGRVLGLIKARNVDHVCWHCTMLAQITKARCAAGHFAGSCAIAYPPHAIIHTMFRLESGSGLHISHFDQVLPLSLALESVSATVSALLGASPKFGGDSWRVLASAGEVAMEAARLVQAACQDTPFMVATPASSVFISDAMMCLRSSHSHILRNLQRHEDRGDSAQPKRAPPPALKMRLHEMANQIRYIVANVKPISRRKADEILRSSESREVILEATSESEDAEDLEPSLSSEDEGRGDGIGGAAGEEAEDDESSEDGFICFTAANP